MYNKTGIINWAWKPLLSILTDSCYEKDLTIYFEFFCSSLSPIDATDILKQMRQDKTIKIIDMYPSDFKCLFETIECSKDHTCKWLYDDFMEDVVV